ncbi:MAG: molybdopterin-dependent oxidoreductase, partial [Paracoccaceae bacterium]
GIMQHNAPSRLRAPMKRVGPRGSGEFEEISWDEALEMATDWMGKVRKTDPKRLAFFTGRDQSQSLTGLWAMKFGTPNFAAHGGFCSVNMAAGGLYTFGGAFWEFGDPDWDKTKYFMLFGVAEDHASNPIKIGIGKLKNRGAKVVSVNPVRTGYNAVADEWVGIRPGTDGLFVGALIHELFRTQQIDLDYLRRYTNAAWLVIDAPGTADNGLFARGEDGEKLVWCNTAQGFESSKNADADAALTGPRTLPDGRRARPVFELMAERYLGDEYAPETVAAETGLGADDMRRIAAELAHVAFKEEIVLDQPWTDWAGRKHDKMIGRPVSMHAMRGISAHSNGFQTCRSLHILQIILGTVEVPGGFRFKPPYPKPITAHPKPHY